jgi:hypothetical protein
MNERLQTMPMSMYSELLAASLANDEEAAGPHAPREGWLLEELLLARRRRQQFGRAMGRSDASSRIAAELEYDRALIGLCRLHDIPCGAARFTYPSQERRRLEEALEAVGVDVTGSQGRDEHRRTPVGHEPPAGS